MAKSLLALLLLTLFYTSFVNAGFEITSPAAGEVIEAGKAGKVVWALIAQGVTEPAVDVYLVKGDPANLKEVQALCTNVDAKANGCLITIPPNAVSGIDYAIRVGKSPDNATFGSFFTVKGTGPIPANNGCPKMGGYKCYEGSPCCSADGFCGVDADSCGAGCQQQFSLAGACKGGAATAKAAKVARRSLYLF